MPKIKNIIIFLAIGAVLVFIYMYFIKGDPTDTDTLVSTSGSEVTPLTGAMATGDNSAVAREFLVLLLSVKNIKLDDAIFSDKAFISLDETPIDLTPDGNEGRVNPFAPLGTDVVAIIPATCTSLQFLNTTTNTCVARATCTLPQVFNPVTNTCVTRPTCVLPKVLNILTNTCVTPLICTLPQVLNIGTNTCVNPPLN